MADLPSVNSAEIDIMQAIAQGPNDAPVFMLNLNKYTPQAGYPGGALYGEYMAILATLLSQVGGKILWRTPVRGTVVGNQLIDEALGIWYPSHAAFMQLMRAPASAENMRLRALAVLHADLHRCQPY